MRALWLSHFLPFPPKGGALQRSHHLLRQAARRHEVHLVSLNQRAILPSEDAVTEAVETLSTWVASVRVFPIASDAAAWRWWMTAARAAVASTPYDALWLRCPPMMQHVRDASQSQPFDIVHVDTIGLWPYREAIRSRGVVLNHHNIESQMMARRAELERRRARRWYFRRQAAGLARLEASACPRAATNLVVSPLDAERLTGRVKCTTHVVDNGVDVEYFRPDPNRRPVARSLVFAGRMSWYPNRDAVDLFLRTIWPALVAESPDCTISLVGKNPPSEWLRLGDPRVRVTGYVDDVRPYLDEAEIYVCPIRDGGGTRLKVLDALAMGKPLIATAMAVEGLELVAGTHYALAESPADFVREILRLQDDAALRDRLGREGRRLVEERFAWDVVGRKLLAAYDFAATSLQS